jgi:hypothetical protein
VLAAAARKEQRKISRGEARADALCRAARFTPRTTAVVEMSSFGILPQGWGLCYILHAPPKLYVNRLRRLGTLVRTRVREKGVGSDKFSRTMPDLRLVSLNQRNRTWKECQVGRHYRDGTVGFLTGRYLESTSSPLGRALCLLGSPDRQSIHLRWNVTSSPSPSYLGYTLPPSGTFRVKESPPQATAT